MLVRFLRRSDGGLAHVVTTREVECLAVSSDERVVAIATNRGEIRLLNLHTWEEFNVLRGAPNLIHCMEFGPNSRMLAAGDWDGHVRVWDTNAKALHTDTLTSKRGNRLEAFFTHRTSSDEKDSAAGLPNSASINSCCSQPPATPPISSTFVIPRLAKSCRSFRPQSGTLA